MYKTIYALHHSRMHTNVYIDIGSTCIYKGHLNNTNFNKDCEAQSVEHRTIDFRAMGSNPTVGKKFLICILSTGPIQMKSNMTFTRGI